MKHSPRKVGQLLVWPNIGPIGTSDSEIEEFENYVNDFFPDKVNFVTDLPKKDGTVDVLIRHYPNADGPSLLFRKFFAYSGIHPFDAVSKKNYDEDSTRKFLKYRF